MSKEFNVDELWVIDFDRTLGDVGSSMRRFQLAAGKFGIGVEEINRAQRLVENDGGSFSPLSVLTNRNVDLSEFESEFKRVKVDILYPDAAGFLKRLQVTDIPHLVLTYGVSEAWQRLKIEASGYSGEWRVMENPDKGVEIGSWRNEQGAYEVRLANGLYRAEKVCLFDDKAIAFRGLPEGCRGYLVQRDEMLKSQQGSLSSNVAKIRSFDELVWENNRLAA
jgi:hypothetical protein